MINEPGSANPDGRLILYQSSDGRIRLDCRTTG